MNHPYLVRGKKLATRNIFFKKKREETTNGQATREKTLNRRDKFQKTRVKGKKKKKHTSKHGNQGTRVTSKSKQSRTCVHKEEMRNGFQYKPAKHA